MKPSIYRYKPETGDAPYLQDHNFKPPSEWDLMVLDILKEQT